MINFVRDVRFAARILAGNKLTTVSAVLTMTLALGACTGIFSIIQAVLLKQLPYPNADRVAHVWQVGRHGGRMQTSEPNFHEWKERSRSFEAMARYQFSMSPINGGREPLRSRVAGVSRDFFRILGIKAFVGRFFSEAESSPGGRPVAVVSHRFWTNFLDGDPDLKDKAVRTSFGVYDVVGVLPPEFDFPSGVDVWQAAELLPPIPSRTAHNWRVIGLLKEGQTVASADQELRAIGEWQVQTYGEDIWLSAVDVISLHENLVGGVRPQLLLLMVAVGLLLVVACTNLANLLLARATSRRQELAVRVSLGASRITLVRQFLAESLLLSGLGTVLGLLFASWLLPLLLSMEPGNLPRTEIISVNATVLLFAAVLAVVVSVVLTIAPVVQLGRGPAEILAAATRSATEAGGGGRTRTVLVVMQVAVTFVLLSGSVLLGRSFLELLSVDPGFRTKGNLVMQINSNFPADEASRGRLARFHADLLDELAQIPGVKAVGGVNALPLSGRFADGLFLIDNAGITHDNPDLPAETLQRLVESGRTGEAGYRIAGEDYFKVMGIELIRGRLPNPSDDDDAPHVAVISQSLAAKVWPQGDAIGQRVQFGNMDGHLELMTIIGIVGDVRDFGLDTEPVPALYGYYRQRPTKTSSFSIVIRPRGNLAAVRSQARDLLRRIDPEVPVRFSTIEEVYSLSLGSRRFSLVLIGLFAGFSLLLAVIGIFGVLAYTVSRRGAEIGIRMALGAAPRVIRSGFLCQSLWHTGMGVVIGLAAALAVSRLLENMLFQVTAGDPITYLAVFATIAAFSTAAAYVPAHRASRVDPLEALRAE